METSSSLPEAPGARAAFHCGLWGIIANFVLCLPASIGLGITAIVQANKARRLAQEHPDQYRRPTSSGLVMGIASLALLAVMPPFIGIVSAIAIPAILSQRSRARDKAAIGNLMQGMGDLLPRCDELASHGRSPVEIRQELEAALRGRHGADRNPWNLQEPAFTFTIAPVEGVEPAQATEVLASMPATEGRCAFAFQASTQGHPGWVGGWVELHNAVNGSRRFVKVMPLE